MENIITWEEKGGAGSWKCPEKEVYGPMRAMTPYIHTYISSCRVTTKWAAAAGRVMTNRLAGRLRLWLDDGSNYVNKLVSGGGADYTLG